ncbi:MAG: GGDEF domain-containing protein [Planctomycetaceae bacterium]|nr:GGDEF domain-containing protein [Planctomycetaceae bacterium]
MTSLIMRNEKNSTRTIKKRKAEAMNGDTVGTDESAGRELEELRRENAYLRRLVEETAARMLSVDIHSIAIRHELEQKRRGFKLMAELAVALGRDSDFEALFLSVSRRVNATLNMQRTAVLLHDGHNVYKPAILQGYPAAERSGIFKERITLGPDQINPFRSILVTGADDSGAYDDIREKLRLPYFIASPVPLYGEVEAIIVTGRMVEERPYLSRLGPNDMETVQTVAAYLSAMLAEHRLRHAEILAKHDALTQLPNRLGTGELLNQQLELARKNGNLLAVLFIDLDGFKTVNDKHGHAIGDMVLRAVAERLTGCIRVSDFVGRIGGDEFLAVLPQVRHSEDAGVVALKIIECLSQPVVVGDVSSTIGASVDIAVYPENGASENELIRAADEVMYHVKSRGKNSFAYSGKSGRFQA